MLGVIEIISLVLELFVVLVSLSNLFDRHFKIDIYAIMVTSVYLFIFEAINIGDFPAYIAFIAYAAIFVYCIFKYKKSIRVTLINCLLSFAIISLFQLVFCIPVYYLYDKEGGIVGFNSLLVNALSIVAIIFVHNKFKLKRISDFIQQRSWIVKTIFIFIVIYLFINLLSVQINDAIENSDVIQFVFFIILFFLAVSEWQKAIADAERKKTQLEMNKLYYDAYDELLLLIRERQHDMKNHINAILGMIYTIDNYEDLVESQRKYCDDIVEKNKETKLLLSISNPLIAGFLYRKFQEAQKQKILIECKVASKDDNYGIPEYELIEMMGILLDNAMEALNEKEETERNIFVEIEDREENLQIMVANKSRYYDPEEICRFFQKDYSSKGKGHGIGLTKLKRIVQEKDGDIMVTNEKRNESNYLQFCLIFPKKK